MAVVVHHWRAGPRAARPRGANIRLFVCDFCTHTLNHTSRFYHILNPPKVNSKLAPGGGKGTIAPGGFQLHHFPQELSYRAGGGMVGCGVRGACIQRELQLITSQGDKSSLAPQPQPTVRGPSGWLPAGVVLPRSHEPSPWTSTLRTRTAGLGWEQLSSQRVTL